MKKINIWYKNTTNSEMLLSDDDDDMDLTNCSLSRSQSIIGNIPLEAYCENSKIYRTIVISNKKREWL